MIEINDLSSHYKTFTILYKCPNTHIKYTYNIIFNKYFENQDTFTKIYIYDVVYNIERDISYSFPTPYIIINIFNTFRKYILYNFKPIENCSFDKIKCKSIVSNNINILLKKCFYKESLITDYYKYPTYSTNPINIDLHDANNFNLISSFKIIDYTQIILELCSNTLILKTNVIICNKYQIYKWEKINTQNKIKIITTHKDLNDIDTFKNYKIVILLDKLFNSFIDSSIQKKYTYSRFIFQSILFSYDYVFKNMVYGVYIFTSNDLLFNFDKYSNYKYLSLIGSKINTINNIILMNDKYKLENDTINSYLEYLHNVFLLNDTKNVPDIQQKYNYHIIKNNYKTNHINDQTIQLYNKNLIEDITHSTDLFEIKLYETNYIHDKMKNDCSICLKKCNKPILTSCCKQVFCLECNLLCLKNKLECALCRTPINSKNKINIIKNKLELKNKNKNYTIQNIKQNSELFKKKYILDKTIQYIINNSQWNRKIIIISNFGDGIFGNYDTYRESHDIQDILKKYHINCYNIFKFNLNTIKKKMKEFDTIGGVLIIPNLTLFQKLNIEIYTDYIIHYYNMEKRYNENRQLFDMIDTYIPNPIQYFKNIIVNQNVTIFDLVI